MSDSEIEAEFQANAEEAQSVTYNGNVGEVESTKTFNDKYKVIMDKSIAKYAASCTENIPSVPEEMHVNMKARQNIDWPSQVPTDNDYKSTNIVDIIPYFPANETAFIVSHSHSMKNFLTQYMDATYFEKNKGIFEEQNIWSFVLYLSNNTKIIVTRHAFSAANIYNERALQYGKIKFMTTAKFKQAAYNDPGISIYGTISTIGEGKRILNEMREIVVNMENKNQEFKNREMQQLGKLLNKGEKQTVNDKDEDEDKYRGESNPDPDRIIAQGLFAQNDTSSPIGPPSRVYVSTLIRTWMTATVLYVPELTGHQKLTLIVSPFIKEKGFSKDNAPNDFKTQLDKFEIFLKYLYLNNSYFKDFFYPKDGEKGFIFVQYKRQCFKFGIISNDIMSTDIIYAQSDYVETPFSTQPTNNKITIKDIEIIAGICKPADTNNIISACENFSSFYNQQTCGTKLACVDSHGYKNCKQTLPTLLTSTGGCDKRKTRKSRRGKSKRKGKTRKPKCGKRKGKTRKPRCGKRNTMRAFK